MLSKEDLSAIADILKESEARMKDQFAENLRESENLILDEVDRVRVDLKEDIAQVNKNMDELRQYYKIVRLENEHSALFLKKVEDLQKQIDELKTKIA